jgi:DNA excision repair protein ERCC-6
MKVLSEIMRLWLKEGHRALIFVQTIQMIEVIQAWMNAIGYTHLRLDGSTPVKRRLTMIDEFNANADIFAMILTTRVGGVGLNIIGANRVVIFDPDWNPMTDVQARERTWRIGQRRDVAVYRLVLAGSIEEKVYQRQVYKHFLSQKILNDPRQRQFFKWNDAADLFDLPPMPPDFKPEDMMALREKYKLLFKKFDKRDGDGSDALGDGESETTDLMQSISNLPTREHNMPGKECTEENNAILQTLFDSNGIKASFNHDKVEQPLLDRKIIREGASMIAHRALEALARSGRERVKQSLNEPTWTGRQGLVDAETTRGRGVKRELGCSSSSNTLSSVGALSTASGVSSADILNGLKQLAAIRSTVKDNGQGAMVPISRSDERQDLPGLPTELHESDRKIAEFILQTFLDKKLAGKEHCLTTDQVLRYLASQVAAHHSDLFKALLKQLCELSKSGHIKKPSVWTLRREYWPKPHATGTRLGTL